MKKRRKILLFLTLFFALTIFQTMPVSAASAKISASKKYMLAGEQFKLTIKNTSKKVTWSSNHKNVAKVNAHSGKVTAVSAGTAIITGKVGKKIFKCTVYVKDTVDILIFAGQSNMTGYGKASDAPKLKTGAGYAFNYITNRNNFETLKEPFGYKQDDTYFSNGFYARGSLVTSFVNAYYDQTKTPVIAVPASCAGSGSVSWKDFRYEGIIKRTNAAVSLAKKKKLRIRHVYLIWMQGENDAYAYMPGKQHIKNLQSILTKVKKKTRIERCMIIGIPAFYGDTNPASYDANVIANYKIIQNAQKSLCNSSKNFIMISTKATKCSKSYLQSDGIHLTQKALNIVGTDAGKNAGKYAKSH